MTREEIIEQNRQASLTGNFPGGQQSPTVGPGTLPTFTTDSKGNITSFRSADGKADPNQSQTLNFVDYASLVAPFIDFNSAFDFAQGVGRDNVETYYRNLNSQRTKDTALSFVDTDIQGINRGLDALIPRARSEGNQDTETNIARGGRLDQFNFSRIPAFNEFNRSQVSQNNAFNRAEREQSIQSTGLDYRSRITKTLDQLATQSEGRMSDPLLDTLITTTNRDRGSDIGAASGISGLSGAGRNIQDQLDVTQRIGLALDAQKTLPGVLGQAQSILQPPEEQLRTTTAVPTQIPLNSSNIGDRVPIQSSVSAGAAQAAIGTAATDIETIPAETALQGRLSTDQFNEQSAYNRDVKVLDSTQDQLTAQDTEDLRAGLQDKADANNQAQLDAYYAGLDQRASEATQNAATGLIGGFLTSGVGQAITGSIFSGIKDFITGGSGEPVDTSAGGGFGTRDIANAVLGATLQGSSSETQEAATGGFSLPFPVGGNSNFDIGSLPISSTPISGGGAGGGGGFGIPDLPDPGSILSFFKTTTTPLSDPAVDARTVNGAADFVTNSPNMTSAERVQGNAESATAIAVSRRFVPPERGRQISTANQGLTTLVSDNASGAQRAGANASLTKLAATTPFRGTISNPTSINGKGVTGPTVMPDGSRGFVLADGSAVSTAELAASANGVSRINAVNVLTSKAPRDTKVASLTSIGIDAATANSIVDKVAKGNGIAALSVLTTGKNFSEMNPVEQSAALIQTSNSVHTAVQESSNAPPPANTGVSIFRANFSGPGGVGPAGVTAGAITGYTQIKD